MAGRAEVLVAQLETRHHQFIISRVFFLRVRRPTVCPWRAYTPRSLSRPRGIGSPISNTQLCKSASGAMAASAARLCPAQATGTGIPSRTAAVGASLSPMLHRQLPLGAAPEPAARRACSHSRGRGRKACIVATAFKDAEPINKDWRAKQVGPAGGEGRKAGGRQWLPRAGACRLLTHTVPNKQVTDGTQQVVSRAVGMHPAAAAPGRWCRAGHLVQAGQHARTVHRCQSSVRKRPARSLTASLTLTSCRTPLTSRRARSY